MLILVEESQKAGGIKTGSPSASQRYRSLSPEEREVCDNLPACDAITD
jgi:hypothetical protein